MKQLNSLIPIRKDELGKFFYSSLMMVFVTYIHTNLKMSKDVLILSHLSTEMISAIKVWIVLPISFAVIFLYFKLTDLFKRSTLFHLLTWTFVGFFVLFAAVIYPNYQALTIDFDPRWVAQYPSFKYLILLISNWHFSLFYLCAELWVTIMLSISAWQIANHITSMEESKRFYPLFGFCTNIGMMAASCSAKFFASHQQNWQYTLNANTVSVVLAAVVLSWSVNQLVKLIGNQKFNSLTSIHDADKAPRKKKTKMSFMDSVKLIFSSRVVLLIVLLLLGYNISINILEGIWKKSIELTFHGDANQIQNFVGTVNLYIALFGFILAIGGVYILKAVSWRSAALITPLIFLISGGLFFLYFIFRDAALMQVVTLGGSAIYTATIMGAIHNIAARSSKHTIYDATKEMVYIPLSEEIKTKGKAAAEMIGSRFGKGSGALIQQLLLMLMPSMSLIDLAPILCVISAVLVAAWLYATFDLSRLLQRFKADQASAKMQ